MIVSRSPHPLETLVSEPDDNFWRAALLSLRLLAVVLIGLAFPSCATDTGNPSRDRAGLMTNTFLADVKSAVGKTVVDELGDNADPGHAAAQGLWTDLLWKAGKNLLSAGVIQHEIAAWSGNQLPSTAALAARAFNAAAPTTTADQQKLIAVLAEGISGAALAIPGP